MFHKNVSISVRSHSTPVAEAILQAPSQSTRLVLVPSGGSGSPRTSSSGLVDLIEISAHRCSSFFAEAAVLVLVLALLDRFMLKGCVELGWVLTAFAISLLLLTASIATEFSARRWLKAH